MNLSMKSFGVSSKLFCGFSFNFRIKIVNAWNNSFSSSRVIILVPLLVLTKLLILSSLYLGQFPKENHSLVLLIHISYTSYYNKHLLILYLDLVVDIVHDAHILDKFYTIVS